jgi:hypothetical protein
MFSKFDDPVVARWADRQAPAWEVERPGKAFGLDVSGNSAGWAIVLAGDHTHSIYDKYNWSKQAITKIVNSTKKSLRICFEKTRASITPRRDPWLMRGFFVGRLGNRIRKAWRARLVYDRNENKDGWTWWIDEAAVESLN